jgi:hypothetical protein
MVEKGATNWDLGLRAACIGGHGAVATLMVEKGATDWNGGLWGACEGGHGAVAALMIERGATDLSQCRWLSREQQYLALSALSPPKRKALVKAVDGLGQYAADMAFAKALLVKALPLPTAVVGNRVWERLLGYC